MEQKNTGSGTCTPASARTTSFSGTPCFLASHRIEEFLAVNPEVTVSPVMTSYTTLISMRKMKFTVILALSPEITTIFPSDADCISFSSSAFATYKRFVFSDLERVTL